jgi:membrane-bound metal-dependent hydrolase YbcI (DUF457 family)
MDILTHAITGLAAGTLIAGIAGRKPVESLKIIAFAGFGAVLCDIDTISLWSRFDGSFGRLFNLSHSGRAIYSMKLWYSHHGFFHSIAAAVLLSCCLGCLFYFFRKKKKNGFSTVLKNNRLVLLGFLSGFLIHLLQDMPTPASSWGGVRLLFPLKNYIGGTGDIWWWNNYDLFLIALGVLLINSLVLLLRNVFKKKTGKICSGIFLVAVLLSLFQIGTRNVNFNRSNYRQNEEKSKEIQQNMLGDKCYRMMEDFDNKMKVNF